MTNGDSSDGYLVSRQYAYYIFSLLFLLYMFDYVDRLVVVSLFPFLQQDWGLSDTQCGMLVSAVYWSILVFTFPVSILIDRWSRKKSIGLMSTLWCIATAACAFTKSFPQLFAARTAIGIGEAGYAPGGTAMLAAIFPEKKRAFAMGIWNASIPLGSALGIALGGFIAQQWGWRHAFGLVALPGLVLAILFFFVKDYKTVDLVKVGATGEKQSVNYLEILKGFARTPSLTFVVFKGSLQYSTLLLVGLAAVAFVPAAAAITQDVVHPGVRATSYSFCVIVQHLLGSSLGPIFVGYVSDRTDISTALAMLPVFALAAGILFLAGSFFYEKDLAKVEKVAISVEK